MNKAIKITVEYEDGMKHTIEGRDAVIMQTRINSAGIMAGIEAIEEEPASEQPSAEGSPTIS